MQLLHTFTTKTAYKESLREDYFCNMDERTLKNRIRRVREDLHMTQEEFAQELGIDTSTYWRLEEGPTKIISPYLYKIASYASVKIEELLVGKEVATALEESEDCLGKLDRQREFYENLLSEKESTIRNLNKYIEKLQK